MSIQTNQKADNTPVHEGDVLWTPSAEQLRACRLADYQDWLASHHGRKFVGYQELWQWSVDDLGTFWRSIWDFFGVQADGSPEPVLANPQMPGGRRQSK